MSNYTVTLHGPAPWGFRLQGGKDFNMPLTISRLLEGGKAAQASIEVGDVVLSIDGVSTDGMAHLAAQNKIKACTGSLKLSLQRASPAPKPTGTTVQKDESRECSSPVASIAPLVPKSTPPASSAYNKTARPFGATASSRVSPAPLSPASSPLTSPPSQASTLHHSPAPISASPQHVHASVGTNGRSPPVTAAKSAVTPSVNVPWQPKVYNTPINLYSSDNACEVAEGQKRGLREGQIDAKQQNGSPRRIVSSAYSDVQHHHQLSDQSKKRLMQDTEDWQPKTGTAQSRSFSILAQMTGTEHMEPSVSETSKKTRPKVTTIRYTPKYAELRNWHHGVSARVLNNDLSIFSAHESALENTEPTKTVGTSAAVIPDECGAHSQRARSVTMQTDGAPASLVPDLEVIFAEPDTTAQRKICLDNPLALPQCAPHLPPVSCDAKANTYIASISAVKIDKARFIEGVEEKVLTMPSDVPHSPPNATGGSPHSVDPVKRSVAVQTCDVLAFDDPSPAPTSVGAADPITSLSPASKRTIFRNPLEALPKSALSFPPGKQSPKAKNAAATITAVLTAQASGEHSEVLQPIGPATASVKPISKPSGVCRTSTAAAVSSPAFKPSGASGAAKTTIWQPGNSTVNSFSKATLPTANVAPANSTPNSKVPSTATNKPPAVQDDDTLVQMAEHIPAGNRTPMCAHCNLVIRGPFLVAMGRSWHPEEFTCTYCSLTLAHIGFVEEKGSVYCEKCYEQFFAPECARCQRKILGEIINALKQTWHVNCFVCVACMQPIRNNVFHMEGGDPYCEKDYYNLFGTNCHGCDFPIEAGDKFLQALGHTWHDTCFVCAVCCANLEGQTFYSKKDKLLCKKHAHTVNV